jgi:pimeloyl-ACP methyl ester carboxylesterase
MNSTAASHAPIVLVHGAWHGAWAWSLVLPRLAAAGRTAIALDAEGHGLDARLPASASARPFDAGAFATEPTPLAHVTLESATSRLAGELAALGGPVVLVGHSLLGHLITAVAERVPELVERLVYVCAVLPGSGADAFGYAMSAENEGEEIGPLLCADPGVVGALRCDPRSPDPAYQAAFRSALFHDVPEQLATGAMRLLSTDMPLGIPAGSSVLTAERFGAIPRTYVRCSEDRTLRPALQDRLVAEADAAFPAGATRVVELATSHSPFLSQPAALADALLGA